MTIERKERKDWETGGVILRTSTFLIFSIRLAVDTNTLFTVDFLLSFYFLFKLL